MQPPDDLTALLDGRPIREIEPGLYSVLSAELPEQRYDRRARAYDRMIGSRLYNRLFWGTSPESYREFARKAVVSTESGWLLDAGCGTLLLTAKAYCAAPHRPIVAVDHSIGMLRQARARLRDINGRMPSHVVLLQADLLDLPFAQGRFTAILSMGMFHLFEHLDPILEALRRALRPDGDFYCSSLVANNRFGDRYLSFLHRAGEVAAPRELPELEREFSRRFAAVDASHLEGNMAFIRARGEDLLKNEIAGIHPIHG